MFWHLSLLGVPENSEAISRFTSLSCSTVEADGSSVQMERVTTNYVSFWVSASFPEVIPQIREQSFMKSHGTFWINYCCSNPPDSAEHQQAPGAISGSSLKKHVPGRFLRFLASKDRVLPGILIIIIFLIIVIICLLACCCIFTLNLIKFL